MFRNLGGPRILKIKGRYSTTLAAPLYVKFAFNKEKKQK